MRILGPIEIATDDGRPAGVAGGRVRALLARLALDPGRPVGAAALVDAIWDDQPPADPTHALQSLVSRLRGRLGDAQLVVAAPAGGYRLAVEPDAVDAHRFERLAARGSAALRDGELERASELLRDALALWRGPALADLPDDRFARTAAAALEDRRLAAVADRVDAELALGHGELLVPELEALTGEHPLNERLAGQLIAALCAAGRQAEALATYERVRARLADELGVPPSRELQGLHLAVLQGDPALSPPAPAGRRGARRRSNLPAAVTSFVGREAELERIGALLAESRLVTLVGPGGAGKTRLAREAAAGWVDRVTVGVWMVELAPLAAPVEVVPAVLGALGLREAALLERSGQPAPRDGLERLLDVLAEHEAVLVLDNCEHLIGPVAELVDELLGRCPGVRVLATSREPLAIGGESLAPVPPLGLPEPGASAAAAIAHPAVRLFADRAAAVRPGFAVDDANVAATVEVCRRLDGLPLAIELAAARLRSLSVDELAARLDDRFRLLTGGSRTALPRHRTLRAVVDWSWELLDEPERRLARRLAVFTAGATVESAAAVCADGAATPVDVLDGLAGLVDRSLLIAVPDAEPPRYRMLETIREYGLERLAEAGEVASVRAAHARWFTALAIDADARLRGPDQVRAFALLDAERENVLAALRWLGDAGDARAALRLAVALAWFWVLSSSQHEAAAWLAFAAAVPGDADPVDRLIAETMASLGEQAGRPRDTEALRARLAELSDTIDAIDDADRPLVAVAKPVLALMARDPELADRRQAAAIAHPDPWVRATSLLLAGVRAENAGEPEKMGELVAAALEAFEAIGDRWGTALAWTLESGRRLLGGDLDGADEAIARAAAGWSALRTSAGGWLLDLRRAEVALRRGDLEGARAHARSAREHGDLESDDRAFVQAVGARVALCSGDVEGARREVAEALDRLARSGPTMAEQGHAAAMLQSIACCVDLAAGDIGAAEARLAPAYAAAVGSEDLPIVAHVGVAAAAVAAARGTAADAAELLGAAAVLRGAEDRGSPEIAALHARLSAALGDDAFAAAYDRGRALTREDAVARLKPVTSGTAPVGA